MSQVTKTQNYWDKNIYFSSVSEPPKFFPMSEEQAIGPVDTSVDERLKEVEVQREIVRQLKADKVSKVKCEFDFVHVLCRQTYALQSANLFY
jgi:hypothetical protein